MIKLVVRKFSGLQHLQRNQTQSQKQIICWLKIHQTKVEHLEMEVSRNKEAIKEHHYQMHSK